MMVAAGAGMKDEQLQSIFDVIPPEEMTFNLPLCLILPQDLLFRMTLRIQK